MNALHQKYLFKRKLTGWVRIILFYYSPRQKGRIPTTACANYCEPVLPTYVKFNEGGKPDDPKKKPRSTGEINYGNSHMKYHTRPGSVARGTTR